MGAYLTADEARAFGLELDTERLNALVRLYSGLVEEYCRTRFAPAETSFQADADKRIRLPHLPLISVEGVRYLGSVLAENQDYFVYPELGLVRLDDPDRFSRRRKSISVDYTFGYETVPSIVKKTVADLIRLEVGGDTAEDGIAVSRDPSIISENFDGEYAYQKGAKTAEDMRRDILSLLDAFVQPVYEAGISETGTVRARLL